MTALAPVLLLAAAASAAHGQAAGGPDPTEATIVAGGAAPAASARDGAWQVGTGAGAITFRIDGRILSGRTPCGPITAMINDLQGGVETTLLTMPENCPRRFERNVLLFVTHIMMARRIAVVDGSLEARDAGGAILFTAAPIDPVLVPVGAGDLLDGTWSPPRARARGGPAAPAPVLRIRGTQLVITGACNEYAATLSTGPFLMDAYESRILITSATQRLCAQPGAEQADADLIRTLEGVRWIRIANGRLELLSSPRQPGLTLVRQ